MFDARSDNGNSAAADAELATVPSPTFEMTRKSRSDEAVASLLLELLATIRSNIPDAVVGKDPEALHELRVAVRKSRALQREFKSVFPPDEIAAFRDGCKWLQRLTNPVRDLDVLLADLERWSFERPELAKDLAFSIRVLRKRRTAERRKLKNGLTGARATNLFVEWEGMLKGLPQLDTADRPAARQPIGKLAAKRIHKRYDELLKMGDQLDDDSPNAEFHELRKRGKDLKCLMLYFGDFYPKQTVKPFKSNLSSLHDVLGGMQDTVVQQELLTETADELVAAQAPAGALLALGGLLEDMRFEQEYERDAFEDCFTSLSKKKRRKAVRAL